MITKFQFTNKNIKNLELYYRKDTTDANAINEVIVKNGYKKNKLGFTFESNEYWLDLGGHIGTFSKLLNHTYKCKTKTFEPDEENFEILKFNLKNYTDAKLYNSAVTTSKDDYVKFYKPTKENDKYKFSTIPNKRVYKELKNTNVSEVFNESFDGCKMDIEGSELEFIDLGILPKCEKLVMEYHITKDRSMKNFFRRMQILRDYYHIVHYRQDFNNFKEEDTFPYGIDPIIHCIKRR